MLLIECTFNVHGIVHSMYICTYMTCTLKVHKDKSTQEKIRQAKDRDKRPHDSTSCDDHINDRETKTKIIVHFLTKNSDNQGSTMTAGALMVQLQQPQRYSDHRYS